MIKIKEKINTSGPFIPTPDGYPIHSFGSHDEIADKLIEVATRYPNMKVYSHEIVSERQNTGLSEYWTYEDGSPAKLTVPSNLKAFKIDSYWIHYYIIVLLQ